MTDYEATPEQWERLEQRYNSGNDLVAAVLALREELADLAEETLREDNALEVILDDLIGRIERLESIKRPASRVYEINEPLQLTPEQAQHVRDLLAPNSKPTPNSSQIGSSLVERVQAAIHDVEFPHGDDEARAAIREVAAWFGDRATPGTPQWIAAAELTDEAER